MYTTTVVQCSNMRTRISLSGSTIRVPTRIGCPISWTPSRGACRLLGLRVSVFTVHVPISRAILIQEGSNTVAEMLLAVLSVCSEEELGDTSSDEDETRTLADLALSPNEIAQRRQQIRNKILAVGRMQRVFQILRCVTFAILSLHRN
jgi:hypothetical protein